MANRQIALVVPAAAGAGASARISALERDSRVIEWSGGAGEDDTFIEVSNDNANWTRLNRLFSTQGKQDLDSSGLFARVNRSTVGVGSALVVSISGAETIGIENGWQMDSHPAVATQATVTRAAAPGVRHILTGLQAMVSAAAGAVVVPTMVYVRDGATGAGAILWSGCLAAAINTKGEIAEQFFTQPIQGTAGNAMTVEFAAAGAAASQENISAQGYDIP